MKLITLVKELQSQGVNVKYRVRKDGGILVTEVEGLKFKSAEGNRFVRNLTGQQLSEAQIKQRQKIKPPKRVAPARRRKPPIPENVKKEIQKLQRMYRKQGTKGKPTIRNYRYVAEKYGEEKAQQLLKQSEYYVKGIAYTENIEALIMRLEQIASLVEASGENAQPIQDLIDATKNYTITNREDFTEEKLQWLLAAIYDFEASWNMYQSGTGDYSDPDLILGDFKANYLSILQS